MRTRTQTTPPAGLAVSTLRGTVFMFASVVFFTINTLVLRHLGGTLAIDPWLALLFRAFVGIIVTLSLARLVGKVTWRPLFTDRFLAGRGITGLIGTYFFYVSIPLLGAGLSAVVGNTYVLFGAVAAFFFLGEALGPKRIGWLLVALVGIGLLGQAGFTGATGADSAFILGLGAGLAGAIFSALTIVLVRQLTGSHNSATIFMAQCVYILAAATPLALLRFENPGKEGFFWLTASGVCAAFGQLTMNQGYRYLTVTTGASIQLALPVLAAIGGLILFGEVLTALQVLGAAIVVASCWKISARG